MLAQATFALIAAFTLGSLDYLIARGGPDWNPGGVAYAMEPPRTYLAATPAPDIVAEAPPALDAAPETVDYSVTSEVLLGGPETTLASVDPASVPFSYAFETHALLVDYGLPAGGMDWR